MCALIRAYTCNALLLPLFVYVYIYIYDTMSPYFYFEFLAVKS